MVSGARGGLGGTSGRRVTEISQASAMLTYGPAKKHDKIGVAQLISGRIAGRHEGARRGDS
jgi:hypothetical protein